MAKSIIVEGKTTAEALEKGLKELHVSKNMVDIKTIEEGEKRSFYSILTPRVVKLELTVKEGAEEKIEEQPSVKREKRKPNENMKEIEEAEKKIQQFLKSLLGNEDVEYSTKIEDFTIFVEINGEKVSSLIGYRGETINAMQTIISLIANKGVDEKINVFVDVAGYKEKRVKTLEEMADKFAKKVEKTRKAITLEPMTAYERKIIHTRLQNNDKIKTFSKGEEPHRRLVITLK